MADEKLRALIQKMMDSGASEDTIRTVIQEFKGIGKPDTGGKVPIPPPMQPISEPSSWGAGVLNSMNPWGGNEQSGSALSAAGMGGAGFAKGAILDIPSSIGSGLEAVGGMITDPTATMSGMAEGLMDAPENIARATMEAGAKPFEFGEMMGQITGQPAVTGKIAAKVGPMLPTSPGQAIRATGRPIAAVGRYGQKSGLVTGAIPRWGVPAHARNLDTLAARGIEKVGEAMKGYGAQPPMPPPTMPPVQMPPTLPPMGMPPPSSTMPPVRMPGVANAPQSPMAGLANQYPSANMAQNAPPSIASTRPPQIPDWLQQAVVSGELTPEGAMQLAQRVGGEIRDASGMPIAPPQSTIPPRPPGPWDANIPPAPMAAPMGEPIINNVKSTRFAPTSPLDPSHAPTSKAMSQLQPSESLNRLKDSLAGKTVPNTELDSIQQALAEGRINPQTAEKLTQLNADRIAKEAANYTSRGYTRNARGVWEKQLPEASSHGPTREYFNGKRYDLKFSSDAQNAAAKSKARGMQAWAEKQKAAKSSPESKMTAEAFGPDFFKKEGGVLTARLRTQFASPQVVEGLKAQGFKLVKIEGNKMVFQKIQ